MYVLVLTEASLVVCHKACCNGCLPGDWRRDLWGYLCEPDIRGEGEGRGAAAVTHPPHSTLHGPRTIAVAVTHNTSVVWRTNTGIHQF